MSFFGLFNKKRQPPTQEDRDLGGAVNAERLKLRKERLQLEHEIEMLRLEEQKLRIEMRLDQIYGVADASDDPDSLFMNLIMEAMQNKQIGAAEGSSMHNSRYVGMPFNQDPQVAQQLQNTPSTISDVQFEEIWNKIPTSQKPLIKIASSDIIKSWIKKNYPSVDDDTIERAVLFVKEKA